MIFLLLGFLKILQFFLPLVDSFFIPQTGLFKNYRPREKKENYSENWLRNGSQP